jgi:UDP:flavonoid glycosyltransferase YjiC (YdhE family)
VARILIATDGSVGDVLPFIALARGLTARGRAVRLATPANHAALVTGAGLAHVHLRPDPPPALQNDAARARLADPLGGTAARLREIVGPAILDGHADLVAAVARESCDLIIGGIAAPAAPMAAESLGIPFAPALLQPIGFLSALDPPLPPGLPMLEPLLGLGPRIGRPMRSIAQALLGWWSGPVAAARRSLGLPPAQDLLLNTAVPPPFALALFSPALAPGQADWAGGARPTGFCADPPGPLAPGVEAFLAKGPPPLVASLGSSMVRAGTRPAEIYRDALAAGLAAGLRVLVLLGTEANRIALPRPLPPEALAVRAAPHDAVFPHASVILHHGGAGTTGAAMRAGRPMLVVPFAGDQFDHAARLARLGVAEMLPARKASRAAIARALPRLLAPDRAARAAALGGRVRAEQGVAGAVAVIESWLHTRSPPSRSPPRQQMMGRTRTE